MVCPCFGTQGHSSSRDFLITILQWWLPKLFVFVRSLCQLAKLQNLPPSQPQVFVMKNESSSSENERQEIVDCTHSYYTQFYLLKFVNQQNSQLSSAPLVCLGYQLLKFFLRLFSEMSFCSKVSLFKLTFFYNVTMVTSTF